MLEEASSDKVNTALVPRNEDASFIGKMYVGQKTLSNEKFSVEYYKDRAFVIAKLDEKHETKEVGYFTSCKPYVGWSY